MDSKLNKEKSMLNWLFGLMAGGAVLLCGCEPAADATASQEDPPLRAEDVRPLSAGERAPTARLRRVNGELVDLKEMYREKPTMLVFYRGGWCPYCSVQLGHLAKAEAELVALGYQVLAISPDGPEALRESVEKPEFEYELLSDSEMTLAKAFGVAFRVDDQTVEQYRGFGIDLGKASGRDHHLLPVPAVYIIDTEGVIRFAHWDADYKERLEAAILIDAARRAMAGAGQPNRKE
jgi:peroxiredoxin